MKHLIILFSSCFLLAGAQKKAMVTRVIDGDTYDLFMNGKVSRVRLAYVDAPEMKQHYGYEVAMLATKLLHWKLVVFDSLGNDLYGRKVGTLMLNGRQVDSLFVRNGLAWFNAAYGSNPILDKCMQLAIFEKRGLWKCGTDKVCPPWLYRGYDYYNRVKYCKGCFENLNQQFKN
jgi:micrococcal nuclease